MLNELEEFTAYVISLYMPSLLTKIVEPFIEKKPQSYGISKYRVCEEYRV